MKKGINVKVSDYRFFEVLDDFSFLLEVYQTGIVFRQRFSWYEDDIYIAIRPPYTIPAKFGSLIIDDYAIMASIAQQLDIYRKRFEDDLFTAYKRKSGF